MENSKRCFARRTFDMGAGQLELHELSSPTRKPCEPYHTFLHSVSRCRLRAKSLSVSVLLEISACASRPVKQLWSEILTYVKNWYEIQICSLPPIDCIAGKLRRALNDIWKGAVRLRLNEDNSYQNIINFNRTYDLRLIQDKKTVTHTLGWRDATQIHRF